MKKFLVVLTTLTLLSSCVSYNKEELKINFSPTKNYSNNGDGKKVGLNVVDVRDSNRELIGQKRLGSLVVVIKSDGNLIDLISGKVSKDLEQNGFKVVGFDSRSADKTLEVAILNLDYSAYREFFIGSSKIEVLLKITAIDKSGSRYSTTQSFELSKKHFIMPLITTDEKTINNALQEVLDEIFANKKLLEFLKN
jgi:uncharacterized lipoprotein YajG